MPLVSARAWGAVPVRRWLERRESAGLRFELTPTGRRVAVPVWRRLTRADLMPRSRFRGNHPTFEGENTG